MKKVLFVLMVGLLSGIMFQSCGPNDEKLQKEVTTAVQKEVPQVSAVVQKGIVTLNGVVESDDMKAAAERLAKSVKGTKSVINNVTVHKPEPPVTINPDTTIKTAVESKLKDAGYKDVTIEVKDGEIILSGDLKRADLTKVMQIANESNPRKVTNNLNLK